MSCTNEAVSQDALEGGRKFVMWLSVSITGIVVAILCLMDLPWVGLYTMLKNKYIKYKKGREEFKEPAVFTKPQVQEQAAPQPINRLIKL